MMARCWSETSPPPLLLNSGTSPGSEGCNLTKIKISIGFLVLASAALHLVLVNTHGASFDIRTFAAEAASVLNHQNVYKVIMPYKYPPLYPYPPVWLFIAALCSLVASWGHFPFFDIVRLPGCLGDLGIIVLLAMFGVRRYGGHWKSLIYPACYAFNPLALLISAGHGQFESLVIFFMLLAILLIDQRPAWSALMLGIAVALKTYPVLLLPYMLWHHPKDKWLKIATLIALPTAIAVVGYTIWLGWSWTFITDTLNYHGEYILGWGALLEGLGGHAYQSSVIRLLFEGALLLVILWLSRKQLAQSPVVTVTFIFMAFYALGYATSCQYLLWVLPFMIVANWRWSISYSLLAAWTAATWYSIAEPNLLPSSLKHLFLAPFHNPNGVHAYLFIIMIPTIFALIYLYSQLRTRTIHPSRGRPQLPLV